MNDPRIDPLPRSAILTDTVLRLSFAPRDPEAKVTALKVPVRNDKIAQMQALMQPGTVHIQLKAGFGEERSIAMSGPELMILMDAADRFVTELPAAQNARATEPDD